MKMYGYTITLDWIGRPIGPMDRWHSGFIAAHEDLHACASRLHVGWSIPDRCESGPLRLKVWTRFEEADLRTRIDTVLMGSQAGLTIRGVTLDVTHALSRSPYVHQAWMQQTGEPFATGVVRGKQRFRELLVDHYFKLGSNQIVGFSLVDSPNTRRYRVLPRCNRRGKPDLAFVEFLDDHQGDRSQQGHVDI